MKQRIGLCLICTGRYDCFIPQLMEGIEKYFFPNNELTIFIFSDKKGLIQPISERIKVVETEIEHKPFPYSTLYRYKYFLIREKEIKQMCDYVFYIDVDMRVVKNVDIEIANDAFSIIATEHPAYAFSDAQWWGSPDVDARSNAFIRNSNGRWYKYCAGGFQGGKSIEYMQMCKTLDANIQEDEQKGVMAQWHDESHFNWFLQVMCNNAKVLPYDYCCQEGRETETTKIIALNKNHNELRS